ncbi:DUF3990 domain-containing protein [Mesorhizobium sp. SP-1A]|uniref:DUF3990 domain-containing protein n=1 Tax=Mesorhizobium sp. SP-1A TaxID=3077840 RepID=UPI0028F6CC2E|nr:DUF3990 domain-containing protein [Mesorhizobium sp. SP-1A]
MEIILYHGSEQDFSEFDLSMTRDGCAFGRGFYCSNDLSLGHQYSGEKDPYVVQIACESPYIVDLDLPYGEMMERKRVFRPNKGVRERLIEMGHDAVLVKQGNYVEMVVLHAEMIENLGRGVSLEVDETPAFRL